MSDIRLARPDDAQAIHLILQETWGESLLSDVFINHISSPEHQIFVAVDGGEVAGFLSAFLVPKPTPRWEIDLIIVRSTSREKGIGASLIIENHAEDVRLSTLRKYARAVGKKLHFSVG